MFWNSCSLSKTKFCIRFGHVYNSFYKQVILNLVSFVSYILNLGHLQFCLVPDFTCLTLTYCNYIYCIKFMFKRTHWTHGLNFKILNCAKWEFLLYSTTNFTYTIQVIINIYVIAYIIDSVLIFILLEMYISH